MKTKKTDFGSLSNSSEGNLNIYQTSNIKRGLMTKISFFRCLWLLVRNLRGNPMEPLPSHQNESY